MPELPAPTAVDGSQPNDVPYAAADLQAKLEAYEAYLTAEELTPSARFTYVDQARRFVRWLTGEYQPRNAPASIGMRVPRGPWTVAQLRTELSAYEDALKTAALKPLAIQTYIGRSGTFVRWLEGRYSSRGPNAAVRPRVHGDDSWLSEEAVQRCVMRWMEREGWTIVRYASGREHGTDIDAVNGERRIAVEVKGYPRRLHEFGANKGQVRKWHPAAQARTYFGNAIHAALTMLHADAERDVALALPDVPAYRGLVDRSRRPLASLGIEVWFVGQQGGVDRG